MDDPSRTIQKSEEKFFIECNTGRSELASSWSFSMLRLNDLSSVPVVVVFTKFAELESVAYGKIKKQLGGLSKEEFARRITESVEELFTNTGVLDRLNHSNNRTCPKSYVRLEGKWSD
jgi:hypothetical protein